MTNTNSFPLFINSKNLVYKLFLKNTIIYFLKLVYINKNLY